MMILKKGDLVQVISLDNTRVKYGLGISMKRAFKSNPLRKYEVRGPAYDGESVFLHVDSRSFTYSIYDLKLANVESPYKDINKETKTFNPKHLVS